MSNYGTDSREIAEIARRLLGLVNYVSDLFPKGSGLALALADSAVKPYAESTLEKDAGQLKDEVRAARECGRTATGELKVIRDSIASLEQKLGLGSSPQARPGLIYPREVTPQLRRHTEQAAEHAMKAERLLETMLCELQKLKQEVQGTRRWFDQISPKLGEIERTERQLLDRWLGPGNRP